MSDLLSNCDLAPPAPPVIPDLFSLSPYVGVQLSGQANFIYKHRTCPPLFPSLISVAFMSLSL